MYIQVTTACNMHCAHCCFSCEPGKGEHMPFATFQKVLKTWGSRILQDNRWIVIGGGEPTLHPDFWKIISYALSYGFVWVATNGSLKEDALALCRMAEKGKIRAVLSIDQWHDPIDPEVTQSFMSGLTKHEFGYWSEVPNGFDNREIRTVRDPYAGGRAVNGAEGCPCRGIHVRPNGAIYSCGCDTAIEIGTVDSGIVEKYHCVNLYDGCYKEWASSAVNQMTS